MSESPLVSVIMSTYNEKIEWLEKTIESVLNQSYKNFEFIIVLDNPSNLEIKGKILEYAARDSRIKFLENEKNMGLVKSLNAAIVHCSGEFIARMDADDIAVKNRFEIQLNYLKNNPDVDLVGANLIYIDENGNVIKENEEIVTSFNSIRRLLKFADVMYHPTWMFRRRILEKLKGYREIPCAEDYDFLCRLVTSGYKCENLNTHLLKYRVRANSISQSNELFQKNASIFVRERYKERLKYGEEKISIENMAKDLKPSAEDIRRHSETIALKDKAKELLDSRNYINGSYYLALSFIKNRHVRDRILLRFLMSVSK